MHRNLTLFALCFLTLAWPLQATPLQIHAKTKITCDQTHNTCEAFGDVTVTQEALKLGADRMHMRFTDAPKTIETLDASGHVRLTKGPLMALGQSGTYAGKTNSITLEGAPVLKFHTIKATSSQPVTFDLVGNKGHMKAPHITFPGPQAALTANSMTLRILSQKGKEDVEIDLDGDVLFATPKVVIAATRATYNTQTRILTAMGDVRIVDNDRVAVVDKASYHVDKQWFFWHGERRHQAKGLFRKHPPIRKVLPELS